MTIDQLAQRAGTTTRNVRALQTLGVLPRPTLAGRTGTYSDDHLSRLEAVIRLQGRGFSLAAIRALFEAHDAGLTLDELLGAQGPPGASHEETYASADWPSLRRRQLVLLVPTTHLEEPRAS